jgi:hypothetical protein
MSRLRPELVNGRGEAMPNETALYLICDSVAKRRSLIHGHLDDNNGKHCALGCFWADHPQAVLNDSLINEVAIVNDSLPKSTSPKVRWKKVHSWLRWRLKVLAAAKP